MTTEAKTMADYLHHAARLMWNRDQRLGQSLVNALPGALYSALRDTKVDPFYDDEKIPAFFAWLEPQLPRRFKV